MWNETRTKTVWQIISMTVINTLNVQGVESDRRELLLNAIDVLTALARTDDLFTYETDSKMLVSLTDRLWAAALRFRLSVSGMLNRVETVAPGTTLAKYVRDNKTELVEQRDAAMDLAAEAGTAPLAVAALAMYEAATPADKPAALKEYLHTLGMLMHDRVQHERWISALEHGTRNDTRAVVKLIGLPFNSGVPLYNTIESDKHELGLLRTATSIKQKAGK
jgi:hypothetical protein